MCYFITSDKQVTKHSHALTEARGLLSDMLSPFCDNRAVGTAKSMA